MVEIGTILSFIQAFGIIVGVAYYILNIQNNQRNQKLSFESQRQTLETRQAQLFMQSFNLWLSSGYDNKLTELMYRQEWNDYDDWKEKYGPITNPQAASNYTAVDTFFEGLGTLVKRNLIDPELVDDLMGGDIVAYWSKMRPIAEGVRRDYVPTFAENSEYLYNVVKKIYEK